MEESFVDVIVSAWPWLRGFIDQATVFIWAIPGGLPAWLYGLFGGGFLIWAWRELCYNGDK